MAAYGPSSLVYQIQGLRTKTIIQKCREMEDILKRISTKEMHLVFSTILQSIFGSEGELGWGVEKVCKSQHSYDFDALRHFLGPEGPLLSAVYSLQADPYTTYEFPFQCLPGPSRRTIEEGGVPAFYINKLKSHGFSVPTVILNAFEMYMFHFAYALVCPFWNQAGASWSSRMYDWLYPTLVDDYLAYFLPLDRKTLPTMPHMPVPVRTPVPQMTVSGRQMHRSSVYPSRPQRMSLFKPSFALAQKQHALASPVFDNTEAETWRSETMLQIFVEFWLNQNSLTTDVLTFGPGAIELFVPSLNQVMVVRMLVKYLHFFSNTATALITSPYQHHVETPLDHFKRAVVPQIVQKKLYWFLRHAFDRWPLDCYFRMVLETWLSYIQPWRYTDVKHYKASKDTRRGDSEARERRVEDKWDQFIEDNLLFYTVLFQELWPRLHRMDFTSPQSAFLLYRFSKVFSSPNLASLISNAEYEVCGMSQNVSLNRTAQLGGSYLSSSRLQPPAPTLPPHLSDMEPVGFQYHPLFCEQSRFVMGQLVQKAVQAHAVVTAPRPVSAKPAGALAWLRSLFAEDEDQGASSHRTPAHLAQAAKYICTVFNLPVPEELSEAHQVKDIADESTLLEEEQTTPDCIFTAQGPQLTTRGRHQIVNNQRRFLQWQTGDPDLQPIRSFENATLVRFLYRVCQALNSHFSTQIWQLYQRSDLLGRMAQVFLAPPLSPDQPIASPVSTQTASQLRQPRVSLRFLASYQTLILVGVLYLVLASWLGTGPVSFLLLVALGLLLYSLLRALFTRQHAVIG